jgi:hypothetical protein
MNTIQINKLNAILIVAHPLLQYGLCPYLKQVFDNQSIDSLCYVAATTTSIAPVVIGAASFTVATYQIDKVAFLKKTMPIWTDKLLPASLALFAAQGALKGTDIPTATFSVALAKSVVELLAASAVCDYSEATTQMAKLAIAMSTTASINSLFYMGMEGSFENHHKAADYALGFAVSRPLYQIAQSNDTPKFLASALYFMAPVARGAVIGAINLGSVLVPGAKIGITSNMVDGLAISSGAFVAQHIAGPALTIGACLATAAIYKNQEAISGLLGANTTDVSVDDEL